MHDVERHNRQEGGTRPEKSQGIMPEPTYAGPADVLFGHNATVVPWAYTNNARTRNHAFEALSRRQCPPLKAIGMADVTQDAHADTIHDTRTLSKVQVTRLNTRYFTAIHAMVWT